jgi:phosphoserine phosphatase
VRAHVFDMDGTLLHATTAPLLLAAALGSGDGLAALEARFASGATNTVEFARELYAMWGVVAPDVVQRAFGGAPVLDNLRTVLDDIRGHCEWSCLITMSPDYFAEQFLDYGFDAVFASRFPRDAHTPLDESGILEPRDKPRLAAAFCSDHGITLRDAVAYGDSMSDVFLFREVGVRIAVNADAHLTGLADVAVEGTDALLAYRAARRLLDV